MLPCAKHSLEGVSPGSLLSRTFLLRVMTTINKEVSDSRRNIAHFGHLHALPVALSCERQQKMPLRPHQHRLKENKKKKFIWVSGKHCQTMSEQMLSMLLSHISECQVSVPASLAGTTWAPPSQEGSYVQGVVWSWQEAWLGAGRKHGACVQAALSSYMHLAPVRNDKNNISQKT